MKSVRGPGKLHAFHGIVCPYKEMALIRISGITAMRWTRKVTEESRQHPLISLRADCLHPTMAKAAQVPKRKQDNDPDPETTKNASELGIICLQYSRDVHSKSHKGSIR